MSLSFTEPDTQKFPMLAIAYECLRRGDPWPLVYNAANEVAVAAFLDGLIPFTGIAEVVSRTLSMRSWPVFTDVPGVLALDTEARGAAKAACA